MEEDAKLVILIGRTKEAVCLGQDISDAVDDGKTFEEAVCARSYHMLGQVRDMISREMKTPWPKGSSASEFLMPDVALENGRLLMWFGDRSGSHVASVDLRSSIPDSS